MAWRQGFWLKRKVCLPGSYPFRQSLRLCHLPQGDGFSGGGKLCGNAERRPPGGAGERSETEGVLHASILVLPRSAALPQKAALQMPFPSMTPPVKMRLERSAELVGAKPLHLLTQTALPLKSLTGAFIAALRSANAVTPNAKF